MDDFRRVNVLECLQNLIHNVLLVNLLKNVGTNDRVQVRLCSQRPEEMKGCEEWRDNAHLPRKRVR